MAKEKFSRQTDVMSDIEKMDMMQGIFAENSFQRQEVDIEIEVDLASR